MRPDPRRRRMLDARQARKVGRRYHAFYRGYQARRISAPGNPYRPGTEDHASWEAGWRFAEMEGPPQGDTAPPVCRFGPGGAFVRDWPETTP